MLVSLCGIFCVAASLQAFASSGIPSAGFFHNPFAWRSKPLLGNLRAPASAAAESSAPFAETIRIIVVAPLNEASPFGNHTPWGDVLPHIAQRLFWTDASVHLETMDVTDVIKVGRNPLSADIAVVVGVQSEADADAIAHALRRIPTTVAFDSSPLLVGTTRIAGVSITSERHGVLERIAEAVWPAARQRAQHAAAIQTARELYSRGTSDDFLFSFLILINEAVRLVPEVANSTKRTDAGMKELTCMVSKCGAEISSCISDTTCRTALDCLNGCAFNDQVCSYRCIASYESPALEAFSLCILQKHNCLGLDAQIPTAPDPAPMTHFNGAPMTYELAESMFYGWLDLDRQDERPVPGTKLPYSWRVFAGKNPAYDYFPCQYQLFYPGKAKNSLWYQPVFKVQTLGGDVVWRRRLYRVRRDATPGRFLLSVLDNGVTSNERWSILDCAEDVEWCAFYYSGAAARAGLSYSGAVLVSRSGAWPQGEDALGRLERALDRAGIKMWELSTVNNEGCAGAPLTPLRSLNEID